MHLLKLIFLIVLTIAIMRLVSWSLLWLLGWVLKRNSFYLPLAANVMALCAFVAFLRVDSVTGELLDLQALAFGVIVFTMFFLLDVKWLPRFLLR